MNPIYEVRALSCGKFILHEMIPIAGELKLSGDLHTFVYKGSCTVGQMETPKGMQTMAGEYVVEVVAESPQEAFEKLPDKINKEVKKCREEFRKEMTTRKIITPNGITSRM